MGTPHNTPFAISAVRVHRLVDVLNYQELIAGLESVFFAASPTQSFASKAEREVFRQRWLGQFLDHDPNWAYVALQKSADQALPTVVGYVVGCLDDPARQERFSELAYFQSFKDHTTSFPAQLHVNLMETLRNQGIGSRLIAAFVGDAKAAGCSGVHVVTTRGMRNVQFYNRNGFTEHASTKYNGKDLVFLARVL